MRKLIIGTVTVFIIGVLLALYALVILFTDAPPIPNDYTLADLRSAPGECNGSFYILAKLAEPGKSLPDSPAIGLTTEDVNTVKAVAAIHKDGGFPPDADIIAMSARIEQAWQDARKGRDIVAELGRLAEIADLTPTWPVGAPAPDPLSDCTNSFVNLLRTYEAHIWLEVQMGREEEAISELAAIDSVWRKLAPNARAFVTRVICQMGIWGDVETAALIASRPGTSRKATELLAQHFVPLNEDQASLRNSVLFEYLTQKAWITSASTEVRYFKKNSSLRVCRNLLGLYDGKEFDIWPPYGPRFVKVKDAKQIPWAYEQYNPGGMWFLNMLVVNPFRTMQTRQTGLMIRDDMLQIALSRKLGKPYSLKARAYSSEYIIDANSGRIVSPGPDGRIGTEDDIWLPICGDGK
jgi:hypothetical protein